MEGFEQGSNFIKLTFKISDEVNDDDGVLIIPFMPFIDHILCANPLMCLMSFNLCNGCMMVVTVAVLIGQMSQY